MLRSMAIRMKEWGLLAYPRQRVHLPLNALNDWGRTGRMLGQEIESAARGAGDLALEWHRVASTGSDADVAGMLEEIGRETTEELMELPVRDWDYSWNQAYTPRVQQMLAQFSGDARERARKMSEQYGYRHSLEGRRRMEIERLRESRRQWENQVEQAVQRGDAESAQHWLEQGRSVFVPEEMMPQRLEQTRSRSLQARWQQRLQQNPHAALIAWQDAHEQKPEGEEELKLLNQVVEKTRTGLRSSLAIKMAAGVEQGVEPDAGALEQAVQAGVINPEILQTARQPRHNLSADEACCWLRRIDERSGKDDDLLLVEIAAAPIPAGERQQLLQRVQQTAAIPFNLRQAVSNRLWNMYHDGRFGCPGDEAALRCLGRLQEKALAQLENSSGAKWEQWLDGVQKNCDEWVCYQPE